MKDSNKPTEQPLMDGYTHGDRLGSIEGSPFNNPPASRVEELKRKLVDINNLGDSRYPDKLEELGLSPDATDEEIESALKDKDLNEVTQVETTDSLVEANSDNVANLTEEAKNIAVDSTSSPAE